MHSLAAGALVKLTYGYEALPTAEEYVKLATDASTSVMELGVTGMNLVDIFPSGELIFFASFSNEIKHPVSSLSPFMASGTELPEKGERNQGAHGPDVGLAL